LYFHSCVDAQGRVGFAVAEPSPDFDDRGIERDEHAGVAVAEVVKGRRGGGDAGLPDGSLERFAGTFRSMPLPLRLANTNASGVGLGFRARG
jgi:hypothetical protein